VPSYFAAAAEWEYVFTGADGRLLHTVNIGIRAANGRTFHDHVADRRLRLHPQPGLLSADTG
jgi:hypothetical protein